MTIVSHLQQKLSLTCHRQLLVAYSGGMDSHVLLQSLVGLRQTQANIHIRAIHVNHHLSPHADAWQQHCLQVCNELQVDLIVEHLFLNKSLKQSLEELARNGRYDIFKRVLQNNEVLLTAHHQDDQAETFLLQLFRGSGVKGLASIAEYKKFAQGELLRPFLSLSREELLAYAKLEKLRWIEDESNAELSFDRNYLRHEVLPKLIQRWPGLNNNLSRSAIHCVQADRLLEEYALRDLHDIADFNAKTLQVSGLLNFSSAQQRNIIRHWLIILGFNLPSEKKLLEMQKSVLNAAIDAMPLIRWKGVEIRRYRDKIYAMFPQCETAHSDTIVWHLHSDLELPQQILKRSQLQKMAVQYDSQHTLTVRFRQGGECIKINGHTRSLKKLMQMWGVPPWQRNQIPLLYHDDRLIAVYGYCKAD